MTIIVTERGHTEITQVEWSVLRDSDAFWRLVENKVLGVAGLPGGRVRLDGSNFVGRASCDGQVLELNEKVEGALLALLRTGSPSLRTVSTAAPLTKLGPMVALLAEAFVGEVRSYVGRGREWVYRSQRRTSSTIGGRLNVSETMRLRASGRRHQATFCRDEVSHATDMNRLLYAGLREIETLTQLMPIADSTLSGARAMSLFFEDCRDAEIVFGSSDKLAEMAAILRESGLYDEYENLLALAGILLSHNSFDPGETLPGIAPFSWFINLANLFEDTIRRRLRAVVANEFQIMLGRVSGLPVFHSGALLAHPDIVISNSSFAIVGDVKYKEWSAAAEASDLYQLLIHARVFNGDRAFLIYPSDSFAEVRLGSAVTGCETWLFAVDVRDLDTGLRRICESMSISTREAGLDSDLSRSTYNQELKSVSAATVDV
jgi:5-methylcytosine-specific restriction endonuclease McrBC regulatory subunit McrC